VAHKNEVRPVEKAYEVKLSLTQHLGELRERLIKSLLALVAGFCLCYALIDPIFALMARPLRAVLPPEATLIFTSYPEAFFTYLKLALTCGLFVGSPIILYQIWAFVAPGLYEKERRWALPLTVVSSLFFVGGGLFGYLVVFPAAFRFLASYSGESLRLLPSVSEYFTLTVRLLLGFGIAFELPIFMVLLGVIGLIDARMLRKNRKYAVLAIFVIAAILTPTPDVLNQCLMAGPLIVLYEISIMLVWLVRRRAKEPAAAP
jgi:sec-independent protein translocase protein TatC